MNSLLGEANGCAIVSTLDDDDGNYTYYNQECCDNNSTVRLLSLEDSGHAPFLDADLFVVDKPGAELTTIDTTKRAWEFCLGYSKATKPVLELIVSATNCYR